MPGVIRTEIVVILVLAGAAIGWALGQYLSRKAGIA